MNEWIDDIQREAEAIERSWGEPVAYGGTLWQEDPHNLFIPVSERLRLHYCEGAHAGLRGDWARLVREEAAMRRAFLRAWRIALRNEVPVKFTPDTYEEGGPF